MAYTNFVLECLGGLANILNMIANRGRHQSQRKSLVALVQTRNDFESATSINKGTQMRGS